MCFVLSFGSCQVFDENNIFFSYTMHSMLGLGKESKISLTYNNKCINTDEFYS